MIELLTGQPERWVVGARATRQRGEGPFPAPVFSGRARTMTITGKDGNQLSLRVIAPAQPRGVYLHLHGGGWVLGGADMQHPMLERIADNTGQAVVAVEYRLALGTSISGRRELRPYSTVTRRIRPSYTCGLGDICPMRPTMSPLDTASAYGPVSADSVPSCPCSGTDCRPSSMLINNAGPCLDTKLARAQRRPKRLFQQCHFNSKMLAAPTSVRMMAHPPAIIGGDLTQKARAEVGTSFVQCWVLLPGEPSGRGVS